jgi:hypothetical protein
MRKPRLEAIESEIRKEKAEALGKAGERLERALQELDTLRQDFFHLITVRASGPSREGREGISAEVERRLAEYAMLREQARQFRHALIIQREAVGLWRHEDVDRQYPMPGPLTLPGPAHHEAER